MNRELKAEIIRHFDNQADAACALRLQESRLSRIIHRRVLASPKEVEAFARVFGREKARRLLSAEPDTVS